MQPRTLLVAVVAALASTFLGESTLLAQGNTSPQGSRSPASGSSFGRLLDSDQSTPGGYIASIATEVKHINMVEVPAATEGILTALKIEEGDLVSAKDVIALIDDETARLTVELKQAEDLDARIKAEDDVNLRDAQNNKKLADAEAKSFEQLNKAGAIAYWEMRRKQLEATKQGLRIELAEMDEKSRKVQVVIKSTELKLAEAELKKRTVTTPLTGFVEERIAQNGQWVQPGSPVAKIIQMDRLRVEGFIDGLQYPNKVVKGAPVKVRIRSTDSDWKEFDATLGYVSMKMDANSRLRVWVEIENRQVDGKWLFRPGMTAVIWLPVQ